jgi:hypothetical protein
VSRFFKRNADGDLESELRRARPKPRPEFAAMITDRVQTVRHRPRKARLRVGLAGAFTATMVVALASTGGLGYAATAISNAATTVTHVVTPSRSAVPSSASSSAQDQYGGKVFICAVGPNGKQHTIEISKSAEAQYLKNHPDAYPGKCSANRPAKANVCVKKNGKFHAVYVPASKVEAYLRRNPGAHITTTGKC